MSDVTQLLNAIEAGEPKAADQLLPLVYEANSGYPTWRPITAIDVLFTRVCPCFWLLPLRFR